MEAFMNSSFGTFITCLFAGHFTAPSWQSFVLLSYGWSLSRSRHTIANYIWLSGGTKYKHFSRFYDFFSQAFLGVIDGLWTTVLLLLDNMLPAPAIIELTVDDTTRKKSGRKIQGASHYQNRAGSARQEYRTLWGINFVYVIACLYWDKAGKTFKLSLPVGLRVYLKEKMAATLKRPYYSRSQLARQIIDFIIQVLPHRRFITRADGGYSTKAFLRDLPAQAQAKGRFPVNSRLLGLQPKAKKNNLGRPTGKGQDLGTPQEWMQQDKGWEPHPEEKGAWVKTVVGIWHSVLPDVPIKVVAVWRKEGPPTDKRSGKKELEAFFSTDTSLTEAQTLQHYSQRWDVEIDIRDGYAYYGLGKDQCRNLDRIYGVNSFRILMATCRTLWFVRYFKKRQLNLKQFRPWYRLKQHPTQLDVISAAQEAFVLEGVSPVPRFTPGTEEITQSQEHTWYHAA
jgi:hypothetical protein